MIKIIYNIALFIVWTIFCFAMGYIYYDTTNEILNITVDSERWVCSTTNILN